MATTTSTTTSPTASPTTVPVAATGVGVLVVGTALTAYGAHDWNEIALVAAVILAATGLVFGLVVPRALRKESAGGTALVLSIPALLLVLPAFWSGLPLVLGVAGALVGNAGRHARSRSSASIVALVIGALAAMAYLAIYLTEIFSGTTGFLLG